MKSAAIVTDTNSGITQEQAKRLGISLISMPFLIDGKQYMEGKDCPAPEFFAKLEGGASVSTSQPSPGEIVRLWEKLLKKHEAVLHFPMSSALSGSCQTAKALAMDYPGRVFVVDNQRISVTLMQSILDARKLLEEGKKAAEVQGILESERLDASIYIAVDTLEYLKKSGRVTAAAAAMATVLNLKPVLQIQGGKLDAFKKARGLKQAKDIMANAMMEDLANRFAGREVALFAAYSGLAEEGQEWLAEVQGMFPKYQVELYALPISICCHVGAGARAITCARVL